MKPLKDFLFKTGKQIIDCHSHMFGRHGWFNYTKPADGMVLMVENSVLPECRADLLVPYFERHWKRIQNMIKHGNSYLCVVGHDSNETYELIDKFKFDGIGEVKCMKHYWSKKGEGRYENLDHIGHILGYMENYTTKPVFIHWDLEYDEESSTKLDELLTNHPNRPIVLCHCGVNDIDDPGSALRKAFDLQTKHPNLWLEISWVALDLIFDNPKFLNMFPCPDRVLVGVDMSGSSLETDADLEKRYDMFRSIYNHFNVEQNLKNLFRTK